MLELNTIHNIDCLEYMRSLPDCCIDLIVTSPPYNKAFYDKRKINTENCTWKQRNIQYDTFSDDLKPNEYEAWQKEVITECVRILKPTGSLFYNHKSFSHENRLVYPTYIFGFNLRQIITWDRGSTPQIHPSRFYPTTEYIFWITKEKCVPKFDNKSISERFRKDVWRLNAKSNPEHPAPFPLEIPQALILSCTDENDIVFDPFMGSGTTALASKLLKRNYIGCDVSKEYCEIASKSISSVSDTLF